MQGWVGRRHYFMGGYLNEISGAKSYLGTPTRSVRRSSRYAYLVGTPTRSVRLLHLTEKSMASSYNGICGNEPPAQEIQHATDSRRRRLYFHRPSPYWKVNSSPGCSLPPQDDSTRHSYLRNGRIQRFLQEDCTSALHSWSIFTCHSPELRESPETHYEEDHE